MIFAPKMPEFFKTIARKIFLPYFRGGGLSYAYGQRGGTSGSWLFHLPYRHSDDLGFIRPPVRSNGRTYKMLVMFLFFSNA